MAKANEGVTDLSASQADVLALAEEAEAEAAEAEALAAAARARARAVRLRREARALAEAAEKDAPESAEVTEVIEAEETVEAEIPPEGDETVEAEIPAEAEETVEAEKPRPATSRGPRRRWLRMPSLATVAKVAVILLIVGFTSFAGFAAWKHHESTQRVHRAAAFEAGARQGVINLTSLDFKKAKDDVQRVLDSSTGQFRDDFQQRAADFAKVVEESKVVTEGTVNAAAVESMDGRSALVLISATSRITNSAGAKDAPRAWRLRVTVTEEGGQYKMSKVEFVP